jgi:hypothetical protein
VPVSVAPVLPIVPACTVLAITPCVAFTVVAIDVTTFDVVAVKVENAPVLGPMLPIGV